MSCYQPAKEKLISDKNKGLIMFCTLLACVYLYNQSPFYKWLSLYHPLSGIVLGQGNECFIFKLVPSSLLKLCPCKFCLKLANKQFRGPQLFCILFYISLNSRDAFSFIYDLGKKVEWVLIASCTDWNLVFLSLILVATQGQRVQSTLLFNPQLRGDKIIYAFPNSACAKMNATH